MALGVGNMWVSLSWFHRLFKDALRACATDSLWCFALWGIVARSLASFALRAGFI